MNPLITLFWDSESRAVPVADVYQEPKAVGVQDFSPLLFCLSHLIFPFSFVFRHIWTIHGSISWLYVVSKLYGTLWENLSLHCMPGQTFCFLFHLVSPLDYLAKFGRAFQHFFSHVIYSCTFMYVNIFYPETTQYLSVAGRQNGGMRYL